MGKGTVAVVAVTGIAVVGGGIGLAYKGVKKLRRVLLEGAGNVNSIGFPPA